MSPATFLSETSPIAYREPDGPSSVLSLPVSVNQQERGLVAGLSRRWHRERRRRNVGRAYDMAIEIARFLPRPARLLDVGCGNGYIAHHLSALLGAPVTGLDLQQESGAPIDFKRFDGRRFPVEDSSFDAAILCYVLHHAQDVGATLRELRRALCVGGLVIVYEDDPEYSWDRIICGIHNLKWKKRTGPCTFHDPDEWSRIFEDSGLEVITEKRLSRWRNLFHPVSRRLYVLRRTP